MMNPCGEHDHAAVSWTMNGNTRKQLYWLGWYFWLNCRKGYCDQMCLSDAERENFQALRKRVSSTWKEIFVLYGKEWSLHMMRYAFLLPLEYCTSLNASFTAHKFHQSVILSTEHKRILSEWLGTEKLWRLRFKGIALGGQKKKKKCEFNHHFMKWFTHFFCQFIAATRDGFDHRVFHHRCDNRGPTVTVCLTEKGFVKCSCLLLNWYLLLLSIEADIC